MIIIVMNFDKRNIEAAEWLKKNNSDADIFKYYTDPDLSHRHDEKLILLDLSADSHIHESFHPEIIGDTLKNFGLSKEIKTIDLYMSDIYISSYKEYSIAELGSNLSNYLSRQYGYDIAVRIVSSFQFQHTLLSLNTVENKWQIFGIKNDILPKDMSIKFDNLYALSEKKLLWEGPDMEEWLSQSQHICIPSSIRFSHT